MTTLELLAPARDVECGKIAIDHGADAVYIGAERFGARALAGNTLPEIESLCHYAHRFCAKVYVAVNTIIYDNELPFLSSLTSKLKDIGVDGIIIQDMAVALSVNEIPFHASTQLDVYGIERVKWLRDIGFNRVILARELSIEQIASIHNAVPDIELEAFVHGALCVSQSGLCYASQHCFGRSANRGECVQFCRLRFSLEQSNGNRIGSPLHFLSLKDLNRLENMEELIEAGVTSFKIEGRLKGPSYVKNVTAAYNLRLEDIINRHSELYCRASVGYCRYAFSPDLSKTFNRGYTSNLCSQDSNLIASMETSGAIGEFVGVVKEVGKNWFTVKKGAHFANGDGLFYIDNNGNTIGFRLNKVEDSHLFPRPMPNSLRPGVLLRRNFDKSFNDLLLHSSNCRRIKVKMELFVTPNGYCLNATINRFCKVSIDTDSEHIFALTPQQDNIKRLLTKLGNTIYECSNLSFPEEFNFFIPATTLTNMRRKMVDSLDKELALIRKLSPFKSLMPKPVPPYQHGCEYNIANTLAKQFYRACELNPTPYAYELKPDIQTPLMQCHYCILKAINKCKKDTTSSKNLPQPLYLSLPDGQRFRLVFNCKECVMYIFADSLSNKKRGEDTKKLLQNGVQNDTKHKVK